MWIFDKKNTSYESVTAAVKMLKVTQLNHSSRSLCSWRICMRRLSFGGGEKVLAATVKTAVRV